ncbi:uncharacterized protein EV154DRAFT_559369 [Mucor mucedo]|uniref:Uncharacterized protein n=1 Tax=Mucor saturninus TaxID=64648 RepID=A0A8H7UVJ7_9FUNG|nr:uncharacterized protein EV154DRAFT_559369 [Mucor mucedo]KAG2200226.1 hypothetical protein INT47_009864 [Mucor saturninus]KAI7895614.1 hypothetical protein EV154DRAFT_559369 [Mucor mucedo]
MDVTLQKRGSTFATNTEHTPAFTTVHIIAAVIGIVGAIAVTITIFLYCKKRKHDSLLKIKSDIEQDMLQRAPATRFGQFATDFDHSSSAPEQVTRVSPMMQQHQLQIKLLQVPTHNRTLSSSNTVVPPPPPYQP